jgi:copper homeostasis protein CutC
LEDIIELRDRYQVHGVVVGSLEQHGTELLADTAFMREVAKECGGKTKITFHKASDYTTNLSETIKTLS